MEEGLFGFCICDWLSDTLIVKLEFDSFSNEPLDKCCSCTHLERNTSLWMLLEVLLEVELFLCFVERIVFPWDDISVLWWRGLPCSEEDPLEGKVVGGRCDGEQHRLKEEESNNCFWQQLLQFLHKIITQVDNYMH